MILCRILHMGALARRSGRNRILPTCRVNSMHSFYKDLPDSEMNDPYAHLSIATNWKAILSTTENVDAINVVASLCMRRNGLVTTVIYA